MAGILGGALAGGREYVLKIVADIADATKGIDQVTTQTTTMKDRMVGIGKSVAAGLAVGAVVQFGRTSLDAAAAAEDAGDQIVSAFGSASGSIEQFSQTSADRMGISATAYQTMAAKAGQVLTSFGVDQASAAQQVETLAQRAADMAAIWGTSTEEAMDAMTNGIMGQTRGLKKFGISIEESEIKAKAMAMGQVDAEGKVTAAGEAIARQALILEKTAKYQGEYAANSEDLGAQQDQMRAKMEDLEVQIGNALLPVMVELMKVIQPMIMFISENINWIGPLVAGIAAIVLGIKAWTLAQLILNSALLANPIGLIVVAIAAVIAIIVVLIKNWDQVKEVVDKVVHAIVDAWNWFVDFIGKLAVTIFNIYTWPYRQLWEAAQYIVKLLIDMWDYFVRWLGNLMEGVWDILTYPFVHAWDSIKYIVDQLVGAWRWFVDSLRWLFNQVYDIITYPFRRAMDAIKWLWNNTIGGFGFTMPSWMPGIGGKEFRIPEMATGGIVTRPTLALIGEAGPEAVIPLSGMSGASVAVAPSVTINVYALTANAEVGRRVYEALKEYDRTTGKLAYG